MEGKAPAKNVNFPQKGQDQEGKGTVSYVLTFLIVCCLQLHSTSAILVNFCAFDLYYFPGKACYSQESSEQE